MEYDPAVVNFEELLEVFWKSHDPTQVRWRMVHRNVVHVTAVAAP